MMLTTTDSTTASNPLSNPPRRTLGEKAADAMRLGMGTWTFLLTFSAVLFVWILSGGFGSDPSPYFRLNLALSALAGLQGSVLLIAAKRSDRIASKLQEYDVRLDEASAMQLEQHQIMLSELTQLIKGLQ